MRVALAPQRSRESGPRSPHKDLVSVGLFLVWCAANSAYATHAHSLLHHTQHRHLYVDLTVVQIIVSILLVLPLAGRPRNALNSTNGAISVCHTLGATLNNASYGLLGATSTLVWKLSEPLFTIIFKVTLQKDRVPPLRLAGVSIVVFGVLTFSGFDLSKSLLFSPIVLANVVFPLRNVLMKLNQKGPDYNAAAAFLTLQMQALPLASCALLVKWHFVAFTPTGDVFRKLVVNAVYFGLYQMSSIMLLARIDSLTHALANVFKRFSSIFVAAIVLHSKWETRHIFGLTFTAIGFPLYALGDRLMPIKVVKNRFRPHLRHLIFLVIPALVLVGEQNSRILVEPEMTLFGRAQPPSVQSAESPSLQHIARKALFPDDGVNRNISYLEHVPLPVQGERIVYMMASYKKDEMSYDNYGNNVWKYTALKVLPDFTGKTVCLSRKRPHCAKLYPICNNFTEYCNKDEPDVTKRTKLIMYYPTASAFDPVNVQEFGDKANWIRDHGDAVLILGAGNQAYFGDDPQSCGLNPGGSIETTPEKFKFTENALRVFEELQKNRLPITFRGDFTWRAANHSGYTYGISFGCPSLMLNPEPNAGALLAQRYAALKGRIGDRTLRVAVNIKNECPGFQPIFVRIMRDYPNAVLFAQHRDTVRDALKHGFPPHRVRGYMDVAEWQEAIRHFDVSIGVRIHGNMLALSTSVPAFVIATDHRVLELAQRMFVPHTTNMDSRLVEGLDVAELVSAHPFDAASFDRNRCETAQQYEQLLARYHIPISKHVKRIASACM